MEIVNILRIYSKMRTIHNFGYLLIVVTIFFASCVKEIQPRDEYIMRSCFTGSIDDSEVKAVLEDNGSAVWWEPEDSIRIFCGEQSGKFVSSSNTAVATTTFEGEVAFPSIGADPFFAIYPYSANNSYDGEYATVEVPSTQTASIESFDRDAFVMLAQSNNHSLSFKNLCGGVKISVFHQGIDRIVLKGNNNEVLAGKVKVKMIEGAPYVVEIIEGKTEIVLECPPDTFFKQNQWYYISCLPATLANGFTVELTRSGKDYVLKGEYNHNTNVTIKRSVWGRVQEVDNLVKYTASSSENALIYKTKDGEPVTLQKTENVGRHYRSNDYIVIRFSSPPSTLEGYLRGQSKVVSVVIPSCISDIGRYAFYGCSGLTSVTIPSSVTDIGDYAFSGCSYLTSVTIPSSVTSLGDSSFSGCRGLTGVTIPSSVTDIGDYAFYGCSGLTSVTIPSSVTSIGDYAFYGCSRLTDLTIEQGVNSIGDYAFCECSSLKRVTLPLSVTSVGDYAFSGCIGLTSVTSLPISPPAGGLAMFSNNFATRKIYVPKQSLSDYQSAQYWADYKASITYY